LAIDFKIESAVYRVLYKKLCDKIVELLYKGKPPKFKSPNKTELFDRIDEHPIGRRLMKAPEVTEDKRPRYFYRRFIDLNVDTIRGKFNPYFLYNALSELGYKLDAKYVEPKTVSAVIIQNSKTNNLLDQFIANHAFDIREEQNKIDPAYYIISPADPVESNSEKENGPDNFIKEIEVYYEKNYSKYAGIEYRLFRNWKTRLVDRLDYAKELPIKLEDFNITLIFGLEKFLKNSWWEIYESKDNLITKRTMHLYSNLDITNYCPSFLCKMAEKTSTDTIESILTYDLPGQMIRTISGDDNKDIDNTTVYSFVVDRRKTFSDYFFGHAVSLDQKANKITLHLAAIKKINSTDKKKQIFQSSICNADNNDLPTSIRDYLLHPEEPQLYHFAYKNWFESIDILIDFFYELNLVAKYGLNTDE
jgi:hypothetical protein